MGSDAKVALAIFDGLPPFRDSPPNGFERALAFCWGKTPEQRPTLDILKTL